MELLLFYQATKNRFECSGYNNRVDFPREVYQ